MEAVVFLATAAGLIAVGAFGIAGSRNLVRILISLEVMFNGALLALLTAARVAGTPGYGGLLALFSIGMAAAEVGVAVAIAILAFRVFGDVDVEKMSSLKG